VLIQVTVYRKSHMTVKCFTKAIKAIAKVATVLHKPTMQTHIPFMLRCLRKTRIADPQQKYHYCQFFHVPYFKAQSYGLKKKIQCNFVMSELAAADTSI
jgi:hypothetical protein